MKNDGVVHCSLCYDYGFNGALTIRGIADHDMNQSLEA
jgi:hypothetical protein